MLTSIFLTTSASPTLEHRTFDIFISMNLKFLFGAIGNAMPSPIVDKLLGALILWELNIFPCGLIFHLPVTSFVFTELQIVLLLF